jgi:hypothetical protein
MYSLMQSALLRRQLAVEIPSLGISMLTAEMFYKFHSFTLECLAFLTTWFAVGFLLARLGRGESSARAERP